VAAFGKSRRSLILHESPTFAQCDKPMIGHPLVMLAELYAATVLIGEDFADLLEDAFLDGMIDGETEDLAYIWLSVNRVSEQ
jgi:hypothetical protein